MPRVESFGPAVAARALLASHMLHTPALLARYVAFGGKPSDLEKIRDAGQQARAANVDQLEAVSLGTGATKEVHRQFADLQRNYKAVMAGTQATLLDLREAGVAPEVIDRVLRVLADETPVLVRTAEDEAGGKKRTTVKTRSQEAIRTEIHRDVTSLLEFTALHAFLAERAVTLDTLRAIKASAEALDGKLSTRATRKAASKRVTQREKEFVAQQKETFTAVSRILRRVAAEAPDLARMLKDAAS